MVRAMRALRLALDSRRERRVVCDWATVALPTRRIASAAAAHFRLNLKPNINDYSCTRLGSCYGGTRGRLCIEAQTLRVTLIRTSAAPVCARRVFPEEFIRKAEAWRRRAAAEGWADC